MFTTAILCALLETSGGVSLPCIPYIDLAQCLIAEEALDTRFVVLSRCEEIEVFDGNKNGEMQAPEMSPMPVSRPFHGRKA